MDKSIPLRDDFIATLYDSYPFFAREVGVWGGRFHLGTPYPAIAAGLWALCLIVAIVLPAGWLYFLFIPMVELFRIVYFVRFRAYWRDGRLMEWLFLPVWAPSLLAQIIFPWRILHGAFYFFFIFNFLIESILSLAYFLGASEFWEWGSLWTVSVFLLSLCFYFNRFKYLGYWSALGSPGGVWQSLFLGARRLPQLFTFVVINCVVILCGFFVLAGLIFSAVSFFSLMLDEPKLGFQFGLIGLVVTYLIARVMLWLKTHAILFGEQEQEMWTAFITG